MGFTDAVSYFQDFLMRGHTERYPNRELVDTSEAILEYIANLYGWDRFMDMYHEQIRQHVDAVGEDGRTQRLVSFTERMEVDDLDGYLQPLDKDLETE